MKFTNKELEMISDALKAYEDLGNCGNLDEYWREVLDLADRIDAKLHEVAHG